jgi:glycosyltransferase involved in cell wall biosynthesis
MLLDVAARRALDRALSPGEEAIVKPRISIVVPTYRRSALLERCLAALAAQTLPNDDYEIIVVHDGPSEDGGETAARWARRDGPATRFTELPERRGPAAARNCGWRAARADVIAFTDDDTIPDPHWLESGREGFSPEVDAAWGRLVMPLRDDPTDYEVDAAALARAPFVTANCFCRREVLERLGGFDERFTRAWREDSDLYFRLLRINACIVHLPRAIVVHPIRPAPWGVSLQQQSKICFDALLYKKHPALYRSRIRKHPRWDYYAAVVALCLCVVAALQGATEIALAAGGAWLALTARFCIARLAGSSKSPGHVAEMIWTSAAIPPAAVFWRMLGALRFRVLFL